MSVLRDTENVVIYKDQRENAFIFNNINIYDMFVFSAYPQYYEHLNQGNYEDSVVNEIFKPVINAAKANKNIVNEQAYNKFLQGLANNKDIFLNSSDKINIDTIMQKLGAKRSLNMLKKAMTSSLKVGELEDPKNEKLRENHGIKNKSNAKKYATLEKLNIRLAVFILSMIHELYWDNYTVNEEGDHISNEKSEYTTNDCYNEIIEVSKQLMKVFNDIVEIRYPSSISLKAINYEFSKEKLEAQNTLTNNLKDSKKKTKKTKKSKEK